MATSAEAQELVTATSCDLCTIPPGLIFYAIQAALIDKVNGNSPPDDVQELIDEANCLVCVIPQGLLPYTILQSIMDLS